MSKKSSKPLRPRSAYNFFVMEKRKEIIEKNPDMKNKDVIKEIGKLWKQITEEEKAKYDKMSEDDHARVEEEKKNALPSEKKKSEKDDDETDEDE
ncbi:hypothetical protein M9Y10_040058 [Tritrichomonas musculus]|uniref:HMG box domain-containing protein n=1 Tax=Tritrichomonas musculus TaxID=1915356 RepID=A0ABR2GR11_9EUKA